MDAQAATTGSCTIVNHRSDQAKSTQSKRFRCKALHGLVAFKPESPPKRNQNLIKANHHSARVFVWHHVSLRLSA
jgi:hypothetical protein